jgi:hypothetical protein
MQRRIGCESVSISTGTASRIESLRRRSEHRGPNKE